MYATCYRRASQQSLSQAQTHISRSSERVGGQTPLGNRRNVSLHAWMRVCVCKLQWHPPSYACLNHLLTEIKIYLHHVWPPTVNHNPTQRCSKITDGEGGRGGIKKKKTQRMGSKKVPQRDSENIVATTVSLNKQTKQKNKTNIIMQLPLWDLVA